MGESPKARIVFLSSLVPGSPEGERATPLLLNDPQVAAVARDHLTLLLDQFEGPQILVLDLAGVVLTPSTMQELILPLAQRIRGGEYGVVRLVISAVDAGVADFVKYMAQAHQLPLYFSHSPFDLREATPIGNLTQTESDTLDTIIMLGGQVTAARLAESEGIGPSAATNRLVNLDREGYLVRQPRGRREGDIYIEPRSATSTPMAIADPYVLGEPGTAPATN